MPSAAYTQLLTSLRRTTPTVEGLKTVCDGIEEVGDDLPPAFAGVAKALPTVEKVLSGIERRLKRSSSSSETPEQKEGYPMLKQIVDELKEKATKLEDIYNTVVPADDDNPRMERYEDVTTPDETVEKLMKGMLKCLQEVAKSPLQLVTPAEADELQTAVKEVSKLPPSLAKEKVSGYVFTNSGSGFQANHVGKGNQNINNGPAPQLNGEFRGPVNLGHASAPSPLPAPR